MKRLHIEALRDAVMAKERLRPTGGGSKPGLSGWGNLTLDDLSGIVEYEPAEYTITALAGTPVREVQALLAEHGQELPFDPPLAEAGATLGGTVAAGMSGPGRYRYGGVRDFLLGVRFIDGRGELLRGGGKVVKNAAGFDLPKLMVGALGRFGVLVETTFKVFPRPEAHATLALELPDANAALTAMARLARSSLEPSSVEYEPPGRLWVRLAGRAAALPARLKRVQALLEQAVPAFEAETLEGAAEAELWREAREFTWLPDELGLLRIPLLPDRIPALEAALAEALTARRAAAPAGDAPALPERLPRRYGVGGTVAYLGWPAVLGHELLEQLLHAKNLTALTVRGSFPKPLLGPLPGEPLARRIAAVLDPDSKFLLRGFHATPHPA